MFVKTKKRKTFLIQRMSSSKIEENEVIRVEFLSDLFSQYGIDFFTGIPDSQLKPFCNFLMDSYGSSDRHIIAANEGNCVGLAAGYYMSTGKPPCVYMQNSGLGNIVNPVTSLLNPKVYGIPAVFVIGWRGEPGLKDEPQHIFQGEITRELLDVLNIAHIVIGPETIEAELSAKMEEFSSILEKGNSVAFVVRNGGLKYNGKPDYKNNYNLVREKVIEQVVQATDEESVFVSTTGKISRELFEIREKYGQDHSHDFLTVGSMGHSSMIALGIAMNKPNTKVWCLDGDGAFLMHMGAVAVIGARSPKNYIHIVLNNEAHETVGGLPTVSSSVDFVGVAKSCGYKNAVQVKNEKELNEVLKTIECQEGPLMVEVLTAIDSRKDLGRPTTTTHENKENLMKYLKECN